MRTVGVKECGPSESRVRAIRVKSADRPGQECEPSESEECGLSESRVQCKHSRTSRSCRPSGHMRSRRQSVIPRREYSGLVIIYNNDQLIHDKLGQPGAPIAQGATPATLFVYGVGHLSAKTFHYTTCPSMHIYVGAWLCNT